MEIRLPREHSFESRNLAHCPSYGQLSYSENPLTHEAGIMVMCIISFALSRPRRQGYSEEIQASPVGILFIPGLEILEGLQALHSRF